MWCKFENAITQLQSRKVITNFQSHNIGSDLVGRTKYLTRLNILLQYLAELKIWHISIFAPLPYCCIFRYLGILRGTWHSFPRLCAKCRNRKRARISWNIHVCSHSPISEDDYISAPFLFRLSIPTLNCKTCFEMMSEKGRSATIGFIVFSYTWFSFCIIQVFTAYKISRSPEEDFQDDLFWSLILHF